LDIDESIVPDHAQEEMNDDAEAVADAYDALAGDYDNLFADCDNAAELAYETLLRLLPGLRQDSRILDCACGTGVECLSLVRRGYSVRGSDASRGMLKRARKRFRTQGLRIPTTRCTWEELPRRFDAGSFDVVLCLGNSVGHCLDRSSLLASLRGMFAVTAAGGVLIIQLRDWDGLLSEKPRLTVGAVRRQGEHRLIPIYIWNLLGMWQPSNVEIVFLELEGDLVRTRSYSLPFCPIPSDDLMRSIQDAGFAEVDRYSLGDGWYAIQATKA
jgi:ubiquinone/menaquinone biosynthesis C-methylase UbiE